MVVARPVEPSSIDFQTIGNTAPIVPTKILTEPGALDRTLLQNGICNINPTTYENDETKPLEYEPTNPTSVSLVDLNIINVNSTNNSISPISNKNIILTPIDIEYAIPETERFTVELHKTECGLGITVAGYVCEREDLCGIFVKSLNEGTEAFKCGKINVNDRIVEVDGESLQNLSNYQAVEKLKQAGDVVQLMLERYLRGPKYEQLQEALACQETKDISPPSPSCTTLSWIPIDTEVRMLGFLENLFEVMKLKLFLLCAGIRIISKETVVLNMYKL